jgi:hypothetical protein
MLCATNHAPGDHLMPEAFMKKWYAAILAVLIVSAVVLTRTHHARAEAALPPPGYAAELEEFWRRWETQKPSDAVRHAAPTADIQRLWESLGHAADDFQDRSSGRCLGHSPIMRKPLGDHMEYVSFYALYDPLPIRVQMLFYHGKDKWSAISLHMDGNPIRWLSEVSQTDITDMQHEEQQGIGQ